MNPYLLFLSLYSLCIFPLVIKVELRLGKGFSYRLRIRVTGIGFRMQQPISENAQEDQNTQSPNDSSGEQNLTQALFHTNPALLRALLSKDFWRTARRLVECRSVWVRIHVAMHNAAATALTYSTITTIMDTLGRMGIRMPRLDFQAKALFSGEEGETVIGGILLVRLGSLALVASRFLVDYQKVRERIIDTNLRSFNRESCGSFSTQRRRFRST